MEAQMQRTVGHHYEEEPQNPGLSAVTAGEDEQHHEKKSVLQKVKAKARKIKDTLTKYGHGHDQEEYNQGDKEVDEGEEMVEEPEVHGAPVRDSAAIRSDVPGQGLSVGGNLERPSVMEGDRYDSKITDPPIRPFGQRPEPHLGEDRGDFVPEEDRVSFPPASYGTKGTDFGGQEENLGQPGVEIGRSTGMEVDPHPPKDRTEGIPASNYQTKVTDPTGKVRDSAAIRSAVPGQGLSVGGNLERPSVMEEDRYDSKITDPPIRPFGQRPEPHLGEDRGDFVPEEDRVSFPPASYGTKGTDFGGQEENLGQPGVEIGRSTGMEVDPHPPKDRTEGIPASNYQTKVTDPTGKVRDSAAIRSAVPGQGLSVGGNLERPSVMEEDRYDSKITDPPIRPFGQRPEPHLGEDRGDFVPEEDRVSFPPSSYGTKATDFGVQEENLGQPGVEIGRSTGMEVDLHAPKDRTEGIPASNYQTKVTDPTGKGGEGAGITPILRSFDKMSVYDDAKPGQEQNKYTGGHDQSSPRPNPTTIPTDAGNPISGPKSFGASNPEDLPRDTTTGTPTDQGSYVGKISSATSAIDGKAVSAKNVVASKLGYGGGGETESREKHGGETAKSASPTEYAQKNAATVTEKWAPVYEKVADTGSSVISKVPGIGTQPSPRPNPTTIPTDAGNPISGPKSFGASNPEDLPRDTTTGTPTDQGSYVGKISSATSVIAGKAVSAKNVVASKLGYGGGGETESREKHGGGETAKSASPTEYAQKIAATVTEKSAPVHEKVADTGSSVISKVPGIGTGTGTTRTETERDTDLGDKKGPDKGVSVKEYFAEKLRPGDEDKALSEVISDALHKRKEENGKDGPEEGKPVTDRPLSETISQAVSDGFHKREVDPEGAVERKQMGKVTESEEVARRLGTGNKEEEDDTSRGIADSGVGGNVGVTSGVVDRVKGAVASWFGKGDASHASQESTGTTYAAGNEGLSRSEDAQGQEIAGERRLQESGN